MKPTEELEVLLEHVLEEWNVGWFERGERGDRKAQFAQGFAFEEVLVFLGEEILVSVLIIVGFDPFGCPVIPSSRRGLGPNG
jgi:hypothetical protein